MRRRGTPLQACAVLLALGPWLPGCSGPDRYALETDETDPFVESDGTGKRSVEPEILKKSEAKRDVPASGAAAASAKPGQGEPVYSTSYAIQLAKFALTDRGVEHEDRAIQVSYCEGVYTIAFPRPEDAPSGEDYLVQIDEKTSRILKVQTKTE